MERRFASIFSPLSRTLKLLPYAPEHDARFYQKALAKNPRNPAYLAEYAHLLSHSPADHDFAEHLFERALEIDPGDFISLWRHANFVRRVRGDLDRAQQLYERAISIAPTHARLHYAYARFCDEDREDHDLAATHYERALSESLRDDAEILGHYAHFLWKSRGDMDRAERYFDRAVAAKPDNELNLGNYARFASEVRSNNALALRFYERAVGGQDARPMALCNFAEFLENRLGDHKRAAEMYARAVEASPGTDVLSRLYIFYWKRAGDVDMAEQLLERAFAVGPGDLMTLFDFSTFLLEVRNDTARAEAMLLRAMDVAPGSSYPYTFYAAFLLRERRDPRQIRELYERALEYDPGNIIALGNLGYLLFLDGETARARTLVQQAVAVGDIPELQVELQYYLFAHGEPAEQPAALAELKRLVVAQSVRSPGWNLDANAAKAIADGHPAGDWLTKLAAVITDGADPSTLDAWPEWAAISV